MKTIEELIAEYGADSEIVQEALYEHKLYQERVEGKSWNELAKDARDWKEVFEELGI